MVHLKITRNIFVSCYHPWSKNERYLPLVKTKCLRMVLDIVGVPFLDFEEMEESVCYSLFQLFGRLL